MIFFYEMLFVVVAVIAIVIGEVWSRLAAAVFLAGWLVVISLGYASFGAREKAVAGAITDDDKRWVADARDGLRHLRLLFGLATLAAVAWRIIAG